MGGEGQLAGVGTGRDRAGRGWALTLLTAAYMLNYFDRSIVNVLLDPIKAELRLSDATLGFIAGLGFALLYTLLGLPFARLADARGRKGVVVFGVGLWSLMTLLGGFAQTGFQLALARTGVGIGEAAGTAPSIAMVAEYFDKDERPRALSILNVGVPLGILFGISFGGFANHWLGWRGALMVAGIPGLVVASLLRFTVREPSSRGLRFAGSGRPAEPLRVTLRYLAAQPSYLRCLGGSFFAGFALNALFVWSPAFFGRVHHLTSQQIGASVGVTLGLAGAVGTILGGAVVARFGRSDDRWKPAVPAVASLAALPFLLAMLVVTDTRVAIVCLGAGSLLMLALIGPVYSVYHAVVQPGMRSFATAVHNLVGTLGGLGLGAVLIGAASDWLAPFYGAESIRYALMLPIGCLLPAAVLYALAIRTVRTDVARAAAWPEDGVR